MQLPHNPPEEISPGNSEDSIIPEDWIIELQRLVQRLTLACPTDHPEEVLFTVYTWYLDHSAEPICSSPKLTTLGGNPDEWEDLRFPWRHRIHRGEHVFIDVVFPAYTQLSFDQHIAHVLLSQRQIDRVATLLEMDFSGIYAQRVVTRRAIAVPKRFTIQDLKPLAPMVEQHEDFLQWEYPSMTPQGFVEARNGMKLRLRVLDTDIAQGEELHEVFTALQIPAYDVLHMQINRQGKAHQTLHPAHGPGHAISVELEGANLMQRTLSQSSPSRDGSSDSSIPEDWYIDLQRRVSQLEHLCSVDRTGELFFMVQTWCIDHAVETVAHEMKIAHLGGYPPDWRGDLQFPWRQKIQHDEVVHIDLVFPAVPDLVAQEPISQIILTQRRSLLVSILLVIELRYTRPMVFRSVLAVPSRCSRQDIFDRSPLATEYKDSLSWILPRLTSDHDTFNARDGMTVQLVANFPEQSTELQEHDEVILMQAQVNIQQVLHCPDQCFAPAESQETLGQTGSNCLHASGVPVAHGVNLPSGDNEPNTYEFNIHAAEYIPGVPPLQAQSEEIQDLYAAWSQLSFSWQSGTIATIEVVTWFVDHRQLYPTCLQSRPVVLDAQYHQWEQILKARWQDQLDQTQPIEIVLVRPHPPRLEPNVAAHVIIIQAPREEWVTSLISVDDPVFNQINDRRLMRLAATTDEHFTIEQIVQICGYPTTCTWMHQPLCCFAWIQEVQLRPGQWWPGTSGTSIFLSIIRTTPLIGPQGPNVQPHLGLYQTSVQVKQGQRRPLADYGNNRAYAQEEDDTQSLMAQGTKARPQDPDPFLVDNPAIAQQEDDIEDDIESDDSIESSDPDWQEATLFSPRSVPVTRQINLQSHPLRRYQIAHALRWATEEVMEDYSLAVSLQEMAIHPCNAWLVRHQGDLPSNSNLVLVLIDTIMHPTPPSWQLQTVRKPMYVFPQLTAKQLLQAMFLRNYCTYAQLPCIVHHNAVIWHQDADPSHAIYNGDYMTIHIPPPNAPQAALSTRCVAVALHHGYSFEILELLGPFPDYHVQSVPNPNQVMVEQDIQDGDESSFLQSRAQVLTQCNHLPEHLPYTRRHRLGEADVPGPESQEVHEHRWALGAINPTGLAGKAVLFHDMPKGIFAISETHLTSRGKTRFKQELWHAKSPFALSTGYDAPYKKANMRAVGGKHTGVAFLTSFPSRSIHAGWDKELYQTSRIHAATFQISDKCIAGGVCYGYAQAADSRATQEMTDQLLSQLTSLIVEGFPGPAFVAGDFNQIPGTLAEPQKWEARGWKEIQTRAQELWGISPGPTCCQVSRKDFVYLSPALQTLLVSCSNTFDKFPDHSTLVGILNGPSKPTPIARWPKPAALDYSELTPHKFAAHPCQPARTKSSPTEQYTAICHAFENHVSTVRVGHKLPALQQSQRGRGQTLERLFIKPQVVSIKHARQGEYQPQVNSWSLTHCRWVTQCRRLQHYVKHVRKASTSPAAIEHRASVWRSIVLASGFPSGFATWWQEHAVQDPSVFPWFPGLPPDLEVATHILKVFQSHLEDFEARLIAKRVGTAKANRIQDVNRVFKDVRKPSPVPVSMLIAKSVAHVVDIVDEGSVIVDSSDAIQHASVLESRLGPLHVIHIEEGQVWFTSPHSLDIGDTLAEINLKGQVHDIHDEFISEWMRRWDRHRHLDPSHWDEVLAITETLLDCPVMELQPITLSRWKAAIQSKKPTSATGLDAMSRKDLLAMPDELQEQMIQLFRNAESTGQWPRQLLQGAVHSLEKTPGAETVNEYRPITIMPLAYRVYSSLRSREILNHLKKHVPPTLLGNIPGRQASSLWWNMQHRIELALQSAEPLTGATSDVVKAFNHLPREVTFQVAIRMGVHPQIIRAWAASTTQLRRHFVVKNSPSAQVSSTTGFVEGCGLSVVAMVLINTLLHAYIQQKHPDVTFTTYVDNFELQSNQVTDTSQALKSLDGFCKLLDIQLDQKKTYRWAVTAAGRQEIRDAEELVVKAVRDLGAHLQFESRQTNATVTSKFKALPALWHLLSRSQATYDQKLKVLRTVAWPRAMYAVSTVHIGSAHFVDARAGAFQAIGGTKAGANPQIHLSLTTHPSADPEFYALWNTVQQFRRNIPPELLDATLAPTAVVPNRKRKPGPGGVLITRLEAICWAYKADGIFTDGEGGSLHILDTPVQELRCRLIRAWQQMVGCQWEHRKGFRGLRLVSTELSKPASTFASDELGFKRVAQNGTFYTHDTLQHAGIVEEASCKFCQLQDSVFHRHWECPYTASSRNLIPANILEYIAHAPQCLQEHGWATEPAELRAYRSSLTQIPDTLNHFVFHGPPRRHYDLFCDGTGIDPKQPSTRLVAWAVVVAGSDPQQLHTPIAWGGVPGQHQTVIRAELFALYPPSSLDFTRGNATEPPLQFGVIVSTSYAGLGQSSAVG